MLICVVTAILKLQHEDESYKLYLKLNNYCCFCKNKITEKYFVCLQHYL